MEKHKLPLSQFFTNEKGKFLYLECAREYRKQTEVQVVTPRNILVGPDFLNKLFLEVSIILFLVYWGFSSITFLLIKYFKIKFKYTSSNFLKWRKIS